MAFLTPSQSPTSPTWLVPPLRGYVWLVYHRLVAVLWFCLGLRLPTFVPSAPVPTSLQEGQATLRREPFLLVLSSFWLSHTRSI